MRRLTAHPTAYSTAYSTAHSTAHPAARRPRATAAAPGEQGAVIVLVLLATMVIFAMAALVIDVGRLLDERRQLQNGADAAALGVAHSCALGGCQPNLAAGLANGNARDDATNVDSVTTSLSPRRVTAVTSTRTAGGSTILPYAFAQALTGTPGKTLHATAVATWGPPRVANAIPLAISQCDVQTLGISTVVSVLNFHGSGTCAGLDTAGAFGWLDGGCPSTFSAGALVSADVGASGLKDCLRARLNTDVMVPVFDTVTGTGTDARYHIVGFAMLHLTGYRFPADASSPRPCNSPDTCIAGYFIRFVTTGTPGPGPDFGVETVALVS